MTRTVPLGGRKSQKIPRQRRRYLVTISFFFEGLDGQAPDTGEARGDIFTDKEALELLRAYYGIPENQRRQLFDLACALGEAA